MIGNCIVALIFSPIFAEVFTFFRQDFRGPIRSEKPIKLLSKEVSARMFRLSLFTLIFVIFYPLTAYFANTPCPLWNTDISYIISYMCFLAIIEPLIISINGDKEARYKAKPDPDNLILSMKGNVIFLFILIILAIGSHRILCQ